MIIKILKLSIVAIILVLLAIFVANYLVENSTKNKVFNDVNKIPKNKVGLVLGTTKLLKGGWINAYFTYRINAVVELYNAKKIDFVLVSGDNGSENYDEPTDFKNSLIEKGIPENKIFLDYAGFRTLDSVVRAKEVFGLTKITIISQKFHNQRAIYLAEKNGIEAIGYNATDIRGRYGLKVKLREYLARVKVFVDILFRVKPKFLGEKIEIK